MIRKSESLRVQSILVFLFLLGSCGEDLDNRRGSRPESAGYDSDRNSESSNSRKELNAFAVGASSSNSDSNSYKLSILDLFPAATPKEFDSNQKQFDSRDTIGETALNYQNGGILTPGLFQASFGKDYCQKITLRKEDTYSGLRVMIFQKKDGYSRLISQSDPYSFGVKTGCLETLLNPGQYDILVYTMKLITPFPLPWGQWESVYDIQTVTVPKFWENSEQIHFNYDPKVIMTIPWGEEITWQPIANAIGYEVILYGSPMGKSGVGLKVVAKNSKARSFRVTKKNVREFKIRPFWGHELMVRAKLKGGSYTDWGHFQFTPGDILHLKGHMNYEYYRKLYPDLTGIDNPIELRKHYAMFGSRECRSINPQVLPDDVLRFPRAQQQYGKTCSDAALTEPTTRSSYRRHQNLQTYESGFPVETGKVNSRWDYWNFDEWAIDANEDWVTGKRLWEMSWIASNGFTLGICPGVGSLRIDKIGECRRDVPWLFYSWEATEVLEVSNYSLPLSTLNDRLSYYPMLTVMASIRTNPVIFDPGFYVQKYPELGLDIESKTDAIIHWLRYGIAEGRQGSPWFSVDEYLARYPELSQVIGSDRVLAMQHFLQLGIFQGRDGANVTAANVFDVRQYYLKYQSEFEQLEIRHPDALARHWALTGFAEGRSGK